MEEIHVKNTELITFPMGPLNRETGKLCFFEAKNIGFEMKRAFWVFDTTEGAVRGHHAHKESSQIHICFGGIAKIMVDDGKNKQEIVLDNPSVGLIIGPLVWHSFTLTKGCSLFVLSSNLYSEKDYIRNHDDFVKAIQTA